MGLRLGPPSSVSGWLALMRATWATTLLLTLATIEYPLLWGVTVARGGWPYPHPEELGPSGIWCAGAGLPVRSYVAAVVLALASAAIPRALHRRSIARLRRRAVAFPDPAQAGDYRRAPGQELAIADVGPALHAAAARYAARLALSLALLLPLPLLAAEHMGWFVPGTSCCVVTQCFVDPMECGPFILLAAIAIALQFPTRRGALGPIADLCARGDDDPEEQTR